MEVIHHFEGETAVWRDTGWRLPSQAALRHANTGTTSSFERTTAPAFGPENDAQWSVVKGLLI
jgi:hypothetical protein